MKDKKIICGTIIFCVILMIIFNIKVQLAKNSKDTIRESFSESEEKINKYIEENNDLEELIIKIGEEMIGEGEFEEESQLLSAYTEEEKKALEKDTVIIEAIKSNVVLQEAEKNNINPEMDIDSYEKVAEAMYENSDKSMSKE